MKGRLLFIITLFLCIVNLHSQNFIISGKIVDGANSNPLEYATIVFSQNDTIDHIGGITDARGNFKINVPKGTYTLSIEYLSYKSKTIDATEIAANVNIGIIELWVDIEALDEIALSANKNSVELRLDKKTYDVDKDVISSGGTATDVLSNVPSVTVTTEGIPIIRGSNARIMINGRISSRSKINALNNIPASSIQKVEVITTPSSRFSGDKSGGIINIVLKKGLDNGLNGSVTGTTSLGENEIYGVAASLNYRQDKLNLYTNTNIYHRNPVSNTSIKNEYFNNGVTESFLNENRRFNRENIIFDTNLGLDYYFNDYISINVDANYSNLNGDFSNLTTSDYFDENKMLTQRDDRTTLTDFSNNIYEIATSYTQYFERENEMIYIEFKYENDKEINNSSISNRELFPSYSEKPDEDELIFDDLLVQNTNWFIGYDLPIKENIILGIGYEAELGKVEHNFLNQIIINGGFETNPATSNIFHYNENWHRLYAQFDQEFEKFSYGIGLSTEITHLKTNLLTTNEKSEQNYTDFFPSFNLSYTLNETKSIAFSYNRGLFRVGYDELNPFERRISETISFQGNKDLLPIYANSFELSFLNENEESKLVVNPSVYYRNYQDYRQFVSYENGEIINGVPKIVTTKINLGNLNFLGAELLADYAPNDWLNFTGALDIRYVKQDGVFEYIDSNNQLVELDYNNESLGGYAKLNTSVKLKNDIKLQGLVQYNISSESAYSKRAGYFYTNAAISKDLFNKQATLSFIADDIFDSNKTKRTRWPNDDVVSFADNQWREPSFLLSFTWRFNQKKKNKKANFNKKDKKENN